MSRRIRTILVILLAGLQVIMAREGFTGAGTLDIVFDLGEVLVVGEKSHPFTLILGTGVLREREGNDVSRALSTLPGLNFVQMGRKNESMINIRGFDMRQVALYLDGVPVHVSYDGYADLSRFPVSGLSRISVTRGETSMPAGPNALGGTINLVSRKPASGFEFDAASGMTIDRRGFGGLQSGVNMGSRKEKYYLQMGLSFVDREPFVVSFRAGSLPGQKGEVLPNSQQRELNTSLKLGFTPDTSDSYVVSYHFQDGSKGVPPYGGEDPGQQVRFWQFPVIREMGYHLNTRILFGKRSYLQTRWFYDSYFSDLRSFDDTTYSYSEGYPAPGRQFILGFRYTVR
jgi:iron complex outermembrane receptor protein